MFFNSKGVVERLTAALTKAAAPAISTDQAYKVLEDAIHKEIEVIGKITDMPGFTAWLQGHNLSQVKARKR